MLAVIKLWAYVEDVAPVGVAILLEYVAHVEEALRVPVCKRAKAIEGRGDERRGQACSNHKVLVYNMCDGAEFERLSSFSSIQLSNACGTCSFPDPCSISIYKSL